MSRAWIVWVAALALAGCASSRSEGMASPGDADVPDGSMVSDGAVVPMHDAQVEDSATGDSSVPPMDAAMDATTHDSSVDDAAADAADDASDEQSDATTGDGDGDGDAALD